MPPADQLIGADGILPGPGNSIYVADNTNARYLQVTDSESKVIIGNGISGYNGDGPAKRTEIAWGSAMTPDEEGGFYFMDNGNRIIRHYDASEKTVTTVVGSPRGTETCSPAGYPARAVTVYSEGIITIEGQLYFFETPCRNPGLFTISEEGNIELVAECCNYILGLHLDLSESGNILVPTVMGVWELRLNGEKTVFAGYPAQNSPEFEGSSGDGGPATEAKFRFITGITRDGSNVYLADQGNARVRVVNREGIVNSIAGHRGGVYDPPGEGWPAKSARFESLWTTAFDSHHNMYTGSRAVVPYYFPLHKTLAQGGTVNENSPTFTIPKGQTLEGEHRGGCGKSSEAHRPNCGDPVDPQTGEYWNAVQDLYIPGRGFPLNLTRTYSSFGSEEESEPGPLGYGWAFSYGMSLTEDSVSGDITIHQENGSTDLFVPNEAGTAYSSETRTLATLVKNEAGTWTFTRKARERFTFDAEGHLIAETDLNGEATTLEYSEGRLARVKDPAGRELTFSYNGAGEIEAVNGPEGEEVSYGYDENDDLRTVTDLAGGEWHYTYNGAHQLLTEEDPREHVILTNEYDLAGRVEAQKDALERETAIEYGPEETVVTSPEENQTEYVFHGGVLAEKTEGLGTPQEATWQYGYDPITLATTSITDPNANTTTREYDTAGNLRSEEDPLGHRTRYEYDGLNDRTLIEDAKGTITTLNYDENGNLEETSTPIGAEHQVWRYAHADAEHPGDVTAVTDPRGHVTEVEYDADGNVRTVIDPERDKTTFGYNGIGQRQSMVFPLAYVEGHEAAEYTTEYEFSPFGDLKKVVDPLGGTTEMEYDGDRNLVSLTDADNNETTYEYDAANQLEEVKRADTSVLRNSYNLDGNLESQTEGAGEATIYIYDPLDQLSSSTDPLERTTEYVHDGVGNLIELIDAARRSTEYGYDEANLLRTIDYSEESTPDVEFQYDEDNDLESMSDGTGTSTFTYDALRRLEEATQEGGTTVAFKYDLANNETGIVYPGSHEVVRAFDEANRLESVSDWLGHTTAFAYDADSALKSTTFPTGTTNADEYGYDRADQLTSVTMKKGRTPLASLAYERDPIGQLEKEEQSGLPGSASISSGYTTLNQLSSAGASAYSYDSADNMTRLAGASSYGYDEANELESIPSGAPEGPATLSYNSLGERTELNPESGPSTEYAYDQAGALTGVASESHAYGGDGLRLSTTTGESTQHFSWDRNGGVPLLLTDGSTRYIYGPGGLPIEQVDAEGTVTYYHHDQLGSTRMLSNSSGEARGTFSYAPYGALAGSSGEQTTPLGYAGQYTDPVSGLQYLRARYYDPATGQFVSRDPLDALTRSAYGYVGNNPLNGTDPTGLFFGEGFLGGLTDPFNPLNYYEKEIESIENGCSYGESVLHGLQGASIAFLDGTGAGEVMGLARGGMGGAAAAEGEAAAGEITGYTQHGFEQAMSREGVGVSDAALQNAVRNPASVIYQDGAVKYVGADATVVLNKNGEVVTAWATSRSGYRH